MGMKFLKVGGVILGALIITTLGISASDILSGNAGSMLGQLVSTQEGGCPAGMATTMVGKTFSCVDLYEASPSAKCPISRPSNIGETQANINEIECSATAASDQKPWTFIAREQAQLMCARAGKRLPTAAEWYTIAIGTPDKEELCNTHSGGILNTGLSIECRSASGVYDTVGNVWEWTSDDVIEGEYNGRAMPEEGYVAQVASDGVATVIGTAPSEQFAADYIWSQQVGAYGVLRGGFYASEEDAGVYSVQAKTLPTAATVAIGFRCVL
jgi:formylglycine-generating enzyme required for sulfatase activity